jgi:hypothetical protein
MLRLRILLVGLASAVFLACADDPDEAGLDEPTPVSSLASEDPTSPSNPSATSTPSSPGATEPVGTPSPTASSPPVSPTPVWSTYVNEHDDFSFDYPSEWHVQAKPPGSGVRIASFGLDGWSGGFNPDDVMVDLLRTPADGVEPRRADARDTQLGGLPAWEVLIPGGPDAGWALQRAIIAPSGEFAYAVAIYYGTAQPDETTSRRITEGFRVVGN